MRLIALILSAALAAPTTAQFAPRPRTSLPSSGGAVAGWGRDLGQVHERIDDGRDAGQLSRREAKRLRREAWQIGVLGDRYGQGGLSDAEARELDTRTAVLRAEVDNRRSGVKPGQRGR